MPICYESQHLCLTLASLDALWRPAGYRPLCLHAVKTSLLNLVNSSVCECEWHTAAQLRQGETHTRCWALRTPSHSIAGSRTAPAASCYVQVFVSEVDLQLLSFPCSPRAVKWLREERPEVSWNVGPNHASCSRLNVFTVQVFIQSFEKGHLVTCTA